MEPVVRRAAVVGSPISHSKSPILHLAAYRAMGLDWTYERIECTAEGLAALVEGLGPEWIGLSVTMPGKEAALELADERTDRAVLVGSANTLVQSGARWRADCTDIDGVSGALKAVGAELSGTHAIVVGAGGTARPALLALRDLGVESVTLVARDAERAARAIDLSKQIGLSTTFCGFETEALARVETPAVVVNTAPPAATAILADQLANARWVLDAIYHLWPTPLAKLAAERGATVVSGVEMLLNQAFGQVEQFTGAPAPKAEMAAALAAADAG